MPYTKKKPPDWLKSMPQGAISIGVEVFNAVMAEKDDEDQARQAAWGAVKEKYEKVGDEWRAKADVSLDDVRDMIYNALQERDNDTYLNQVYGSYLIYEKEGKYFKLSYSILEGEVQLGNEPLEVERVWVETRSQQDEGEEDLTILMRMEGAKDPEGKAWDVTICEPGFTKNGWHLPEEALKSGGPEMFEGADVNIYELPGKGATHLQEPLLDVKSLLVKNKAGSLSNVHFETGKGLKGVHTFLDSFAWMGRNMVDARKRGNTIYGLSYDAPVVARFAEIKGKKVVNLLRFRTEQKEHCSVDMVSRPAAGGKFNRAIASMAHNAKEDIMNKEELWNMISEKRPDLLEGKTLEKITDEEVTALARMAMEPPEPSGGGGGTGGDPPAGNNTQNVVPGEEVQRIRCEMALDKTLAKSDLPDHAQNRIRATFSEEIDGQTVVKIFTTAHLERAIADEKDYLKAIDDSRAGDDVVPASSHINGGLGTLERAQMAVDRLYGLTKEEVETFARMETLDHEPFFTERLGANVFVRSVQDLGDYDQVPAFRGLREMYAFFTGDPEVSGFFNRKKLPPELRSRMDITSSTFTYVLGNTLGRRMVKDYRAIDYQEGLLISIRKNVKDFRTQEAVLVGYFPDIADVDPEAADYDEIAAVTDEESTYSIGTKGNLLTFTRKHIINDDMSVTVRLVGRVGRALRRTHAKYVWDKWIDNDNCTDGTAWFTSGHGNLTANGLGTLSSAYGYVITGYKALAKMTEKDSGERIGLLDDPNMKPTLIYPVDILENCEAIVNDEFYYSSNDLTTKTRNPMKGKIKGAMITLLTDTDDWGLLMPSDVVDIVEMGYLNGRQEPEYFVADSPQSEQVFVADKIRHKFRHEYAGAPIEYVSGYKGEV